MDLLKILVKIFNFSILLGGKFYIRFLLNIFTMKRKYNVKEITSKDMICLTGTCPGIYEVKEITSKEDICSMTFCPGIFNIKNKTSTEEKCALTACPEIYEVEEGYILIGKKINLKNFGLEGKVGDDEVANWVPKGIIDNRRKK